MGIKREKGWMMKKEESKPSRYNVIVEDKYGNILTSEQLKEKVIDNEIFYMNLELIRKRIAQRE